MKLVLSIITLAAAIAGGSLAWAGPDDVKWVNQ